MAKWPDVMHLFEEKLLFRKMITEMRDDYGLNMVTEY